MFVSGAAFLKKVFQHFVQKLPQFTTLWQVQYKQLYPTKNPIQHLPYSVFLQKEMQPVMVHINMLLVNLISWNLVKRSARQHKTWILATLPFSPIPHNLIYRRAALNEQEP